MKMRTKVFTPHFGHARFCAEESRTRFLKFGSKPRFGIQSVGFTLIELMIVVSIIAIIAAIAIPGILTAIKSGNERNASGSMKAYGNAQAIFKSNYSRYLYYPMCGLYLARSPNATDPAKYLDESLAKADMDVSMDIGGKADDYDGDGNNDIQFHDMAGIGKAAAIPYPKSGYYHRYIQQVYDTSAKAYFDGRDAAVGGYEGSTSKAWYNMNRFTFQALPASYGTSGRMKFVLDETNVVYQRDDGDGVPLTRMPHQAAGGADSLSMWKQTGN